MGGDLGRPIHPPFLRRSQDRTQTIANDQSAHPRMLFCLSTKKKTNPMRRRKQTRWCNTVLGITPTTYGRAGKQGHADEEMIGVEVEGRSGFLSIRQNEGASIRHAMSRRVLRYVI
ncbi:unnamed protein product [Sphagnum balticum]